MTKSKSPTSSVSSGNVCDLVHFFIGSKEIKKKLYYNIFLAHFDLSLKGVM